MVLVPSISTSASAGTVTTRKAGAPGGGAWEAAAVRQAPAASSTARPTNRDTNSMRRIVFPLSNGWNTGYNTNQLLMIHEATLLRKLPCVRFLVVIPLRNRNYRRRSAAARGL